MLPFIGATIRVGTSGEVVGMEISSRAGVDRSGVAYPVGSRGYQPGRPWQDVPEPSCGCAVEPDGCGERRSGNLSTGVRVSGPGTSSAGAAAATEVAVLHTSAGDIRVNLFGNHAPKTVRNFTDL